MPRLMMFMTTVLFMEQMWSRCSFRTLNTVELPTSDQASDTCTLSQHTIVLQVTTRSVMRLGTTWDVTTIKEPVMHAAIRTTIMDIVIQLQHSVPSLLTIVHQVSVIPMPVVAAQESRIIPIQIHYTMERLLEMQLLIMHGGLMMSGQPSLHTIHMVPPHQLQFPLLLRRLQLQSALLLHQLLLQSALRLHRQRLQASHRAAMEFVRSRKERDVDYVHQIAPLLLAVIWLVMAVRVLCIAAAPMVLCLM
mmetsp:Transcript_18958/g.28394  ORF Transcript_18958/g.28394 Transcript_18958/m.28394 type:complete len:249 (+) Transcript_18958:1072-1818(+)